MDMAKEKIGRQRLGDRCERIRYKVDVVEASDCGPTSAKQVVNLNSETTCESPLADCVAAEHLQGVRCSLLIGTREKLLKYSVHFFGRWGSVS